MLHQVAQVLGDLRAEDLLGRHGLDRLAGEVGHEARTDERAAVDHGREGLGQLELADGDALAEAAVGEVDAGPLARRRIDDQAGDLAEVSIPVLRPMPRRSHMP